MFVEMKTASTNTYGVIKTNFKKNGNCFPVKIDSLGNAYVEVSLTSSSSGGGSSSGGSSGGGSSDSGSSS